MIARGKLVHLALLFVVMSVTRVTACPFCGPPQSRLSERLAKNDVAVLAEWVETTPGKNAVGGSTRFRVIERARGPEGRLDFAKGDRIELPREWRAEPGQRCLLFGRNEDELVWETPIPVSDEAYRYVLNAPGFAEPVEKRLPYHVKFLESQDSLISMDALAEFATVPYADVATFAKRLPREQLRGWLTDEQTVPNRLGLYGMMLGLCGRDEDAELLWAKIETPHPGFPLGMDGITFGYLLLTGTKGLDALDQNKLRQKSTDELQLAAIRLALEVMWTDGGDRIPRERLRQSMRLFLDRPEVADKAIIDLARWEDWSIQDRLMSLYDAKGFDNRYVRREIAGYFVTATKAKSAETKLQARKNLDKLRERDPAMVNAVEKRIRAE